MGLNLSSWLLKMEGSDRDAYGVSRIRLLCAAANLEKPHYLPVNVRSSDPYDRIRND